MNSKGFCEIRLRRLRSTDSPEFKFVKDLYLQAFPSNERRPATEWGQLTQSEPLFHNNLILADGHNVGLMAYWEFPAFNYVEHFALSMACRGRGIGSKVIGKMVENAGKPLILEVEPPTDSISARRIAFYERHGMSVVPFSYLQPPYRESDEWFELLLMSSSRLSESEFTNVKNTLYENVYGQRFE